MPTSTNFVEFVERGSENVKKAFGSVADAARKSSDKVKNSGVVTAEVGKKSEIAADGIKDFAESMARGEGVASALQATIAPLSSGLFALGTTLSMGLATVIPFVVMGLASLVGESKTTEEQTDELTAAFDRLREAHEKTVASTASLTEKYGALAGTMRELSQMEAIFAAAEAAREMREQIEATLSASPKRWLDDIMEFVHGMDMVAASTNQITKEWGVSAEAATQYIALMADLRKSMTGTQEEQVAAASALNEWFKANTNETLANNDAAQEVWKSVAGIVTVGAEAAGQAAALGGEMWNVASAAAAAGAELASLADGVAAQVSRARNLLYELQSGVPVAASEARQQANKMMAGGVDPSIANKMAGGVVNQANELKALQDQIDAERKRLAEENRPKPAGGGGGGAAKSGGGGGGAAKVAKTEADAVRDAAKAYKEKREEAEKAFAEMYPHLDEIQTIGERMAITAQDTVGVWNGAFETIGSSISEFVKTGKFNFDDLFSSMASSFIEHAMQMAMYGNSGGFGGIWGAITSAFGGGATSAASMAGPMPRPAGFWNGGVVGRPTKFFANGGLASMAEKGAEAIMPLARNSRGQLGVYGDAGGGGQVINNFNTNVTVQGGDTSEETANRTAKMVDQALDYKIQKALSKQMNTGGGKNRR